MLNEAILNSEHNGFCQYCPTLTKSRIPMYLEKMFLYTLNEKKLNEETNFI